MKYLKHCKVVAIKYLKYYNLEILVKIGLKYKIFLYYNHA